MQGTNLFDDPTITTQQQVWWGGSDFIGDRYPGSGGGFQCAFDRRGLDVELRPRAYGGLAVLSSRYDLTRSGRDLNGVLQQYTVNPVNEILAADPDVIFYMLGVNDSFSWAANPSYGSVTYREAFALELTRTFDTLSTFVNSAGQHPLVFIGTGVPLRVPSEPGTYYGDVYAQADIDFRQAGADALRDGINPLLRQRAADYGFHLVDVNQAIVDTGSSWESYYADLVHPNALGRELIRDEFIDAWVAVLLPGDCNLDGQVVFGDYQSLEAHFGETTGAGWGDGDFNGDGAVNFADYQMLEVNFGLSAPEPATLALLTVGGLACPRCWVLRQRLPRRIAAPLQGRRAGTRLQLLPAKTLKRVHDCTCGPARHAKHGGPSSNNHSQPQRGERT
jgi:lysophospholipase L1-like esterase